MTAYEAAILDVDGTIVRGKELIAGAAAGITAIDTAGLTRLLFSNNPTRAGSYYRNQLETHQIEIDPSMVLTSGTVSASFLQENHPEAAVYLLGESRLENLLEQHDLLVTTEPQAADVVLGSIDRELTYEKLQEAIRALERDIPFYGTDPDVTIPTDTGTIPGSGAILAAMAAVGERDPDAILGKPSAIAGKAAMERLDTTPAKTLVVGDRLNTDIALGNQAGMTTVAVLSGVTTREEIEAAHERWTPDYVLDSLGDIETILE